METMITPEHRTDGPTRATFVCETCGREFETAQGLAMHQTRSHGAKKKKRTKQTTSVRSLSRNALLALVYPGGTIPRGSFTRVEAWLAEAEALHSERSRSR